MSRVSKCSDRIDLNDSFWLRTCHNSPVASSGIFDEDVVSQRLLGLSFLFCKERSDRLRRILECRVVRIYQHLCEDTCNILLDAPVKEFLPEFVLDIISDIALAHGCADGQRKMRVLFRILP